jgi:hypothetical protein
MLSSSAKNYFRYVHKVFIYDYCYSQRRCRALAVRKCLGTSSPKSSRPGLALPSSVKRQSSGVRLDCTLSSESGSTRPLGPAEKSSQQFPFTSKLFIFVLLYLGYIGWTAATVFYPGYKDIVVVTSTSELLTPNKLELPFPSVYIGTPNSTLDPSSAVMLNNSKCRVRNLSPPTTDICDSALDFVVGTEYTGIAYRNNGTANISRLATGRVLLLQVGRP